MPFSLDTYLGIHPDALKLQSKRTEVIADNLANADTPGYKARDIDFRAAMASAGSPDAPVKMTTDNPGHIAIDPNTVASNLANADSVSGDPNTVYRARHPVFQAVKAQVGAGASAIDQASGFSVKVKGIVQSNALPTERYDPGNPLANESGNVYAPNVNVIE